ncbi:MAG: KaiC domain-containing protein [Thermoprotei archaeon]|nr:MAG: KaiC domain-containing protein [Thermoprotei archaeon]
MERLSTGIEKIDEILAGGIPKGFLVAAVGEPGCGKTIFSIHFTWAGLQNNEKVIFVTTEETRESIVRQAEMFSMDFRKFMEDGSLVIIDALLRDRDDPYSLYSLDVEELVKKVLQVKRKFGYIHARLVIDSMSAFWLDKPAMARKYSYYIKKIFYQWNFTVLATSQYSITTSEAFGFGLEHVADGIIRFRKSIRGGVLHRYFIVEKMRQTPHDLRMYEFKIEDGKGIVVIGPVALRREDVVLPRKVVERILESKTKMSEEIE